MDRNDNDLSNYLNGHPYYQIVNTFNSNSNLSLAEESNLLPYNNNLYASNANKTSPSSSSHKRIVYDAVHGHLELDSYLWEFIDTVEFQRLRNLRQLGNCHYIFLGASHSRFEHSIGVAYLSNRLITHLLKGLNEKHCVFNINNTGRINDNFNIRAVTIAGLLHDLGHGPFSHLFDRKVIKYLNPSLKWEHEEGSAMMLEYMIDNNHIDIETEERKLVQSLILGDIKTCESKEFYYDTWIYQIVSNKMNSIDVDKFDYISRDSYHIGLQSAYADYNRIFNSAKVIDNNICFNIKNDYNLFSLFQTRYKLFKQVYMHKKNIAVDLMIKDIMLLSDSHFHFVDAIYNPEEYLKLDDGIINTIENFQYEENVHPDLLKASKMVNQLRRRELYKFVGEILIPKNYEELKSKITIEDIISYNNPKDENYVSASDLELSSGSIDFGNGERNPMDYIHFYKNELPDKSFTSPNKFSLAVPNCFKESYIFIYCKDKNKMERVQEMFKAFMKKLNKDFEANNNEKSNYATPIKINKRESIFITNKRERECECSEDKKQGLKFNKIN